MSRSGNKGLLRKLWPLAEYNSKKIKIKRSRIEAKNGALELRKSREITFK